MIRPPNSSDCWRAGASRAAGRSAGLLVPADGPPENTAILHTVKTLYRHSNADVNDGLFREEQLLAPLLGVLASPLPKLIEIFIYAAATLKNVSTNEGNLRVMIKAGALETACALLQLMHSTEVAGIAQEWVTQLLAQASAFLRNLCSDLCLLPTERTNLRPLVRVLPLLWNSSHADVTFNGARILRFVGLR
ncbi:hypothetical protein PAPYR_12435 [Paratrimastix pyriformis]|uniref:Uncharacterized protein n=1 Tax=Paratrimastix pyriformis TaxID=342808 RepID=A0ABQ8U8M8_9EUKA|nr:hypothetical protein PAPYR_12435 [Paratrimastix pyriformis]